MQAYYETESIITSDHQLHLKLPDTIPEGRAKIAVIYEMPIPTGQQPKTLLDFLGAGKVFGRFSSAEEIDAFVANNREDWEL
jgi:hypothetical protein